MRYLLSTVLIPKIVYAARVQLPPATFLAELDAKVAATVIRSWNLSRSTSHASIFSPQGLNLPSLATASKAAAIDDICTLLSDDWAAEWRFVRAESAMQRAEGHEPESESLRRAHFSAGLMRAPQTAVVARLQSIALALALPGNPLSFPFHKSMWPSLKAPYAVRVWEAMSATNHALFSRFPPLRTDPRCTMADVLTPAQYQRISALLTCQDRPAPGNTSPCKPLWLLRDVVRPDGLGLRSLRE